MIAAAGDNKEGVLAIILDTARSKLLCQNAIDVRYGKVESRKAPTAIVDLRLMFDYELRREAARAFEVELVASHMRTAFSVPQTREYIRSGYPSEPLLAEAAAQQMHVFRSYDPDFTLDVLMDNLTSGLLDKGERGELVARELLTSAYDRAIEREFQNPSLTTSHSSVTSGSSSRKQIPLYSKGVSLITFIEELFVDHYAEEILDSTPNNVTDDTPFREAFSKAKVRFTHFGKMADESGTTSDAAWTALIRGMAIIAALGTRSLDLLLPVLLSEDAIICEEAVTAILISIKRRKKKGTLVNYEVDEKEIGFFPPHESPESSRRPYISLVMELGVQPSPSKPTKGKGKRSGTTVAAPSSSKQRESGSKRQETPSQIKIPEQGRRHHSSSAHPRYSIFSYGCSNTVYNGISPTQREKYQFLLASRDFLTEHPRQEDELLSILRRMKPFWKAGRDFYHWIGDIPTRLLPETENEIGDEGVMIGTDFTGDVRPSGTVTKPRKRRRKRS